MKRFCTLALLGAVLAASLAAQVQIGGQDQDKI